MIEIIYNRNTGEFSVSEPSAVTSLIKGFYGVNRKGTVVLRPEEVLYLLEIRNGVVRDENENIYTFNEIAMQYSEEPKFFARYLAYKDWRDRGLVIRPFDEVKGKYNRNPKVRYQSTAVEINKVYIPGIFFHDDLITVIDDQDAGRFLYETYWIGQLGTYKAADRGKTAKLDIYETLFMLRHGGLSLKNVDEDYVVREASDRIPFFMDRYSVYEDWRLRGYVVKTGFKFGTHFRIYLPGASPKRKGKEWIHSMHVIHVFPRADRRITSEWARAIRVAHSVKKTFILAIPGEEDVKQANLDFVAYHRKKGNPENPKEGKPKYLIYALSEEEYVCGEELAMALKSCEEHQLNMLISIADRETSITYYLIRKIVLPGSKYDYFEIKWVQP